MIKTEKKQKRNLTCTILLLATFLFISCSNTKNDAISNSNPRYGGTLRINESEKVQTLYPPAITDAYSAHVAFQIYEGLVKFDTKTLELKPCLAEKWDIDATGTTYTFHLKKGVTFHNDPCFSGNKGREVTAQDFKYSFEQLCTDNSGNCSFASTFKDRIIGANTYFEKSKTDTPESGVEGIVVVDDHTLQIKLTTPDNSFLYILATPVTSVFPEEAVDLYGMKTKIGTGPFVYTQLQNEEKIVLKKNEQYHEIDSSGSKLPYLDSIVISFIPDKEKELAAFEKGQIDIILGLPSESVKDIVETNISKFKGDSALYILDRMPEMVTQFYQFNITRPPFDNLKVRQAFSYAIDRNELIEKTLSGEAYGPGENGFCPPAFPLYNIEKIKGYNYDPAKAKKLLAEAGYPDGKGFPPVKLEINSGGAKHPNIAFEIQKQLYASIKIMIDIELVSLSQKLEDAEYGRAEIFRSAWIADYPNPENFLWTMYGKNVPDEKDKPSYPNRSRYKNEEFDKLFEAGRTAKTKKESYDYFAKAEQVMMNDAPLMILWYDENYRIMQSNVKNFHGNPMRYRNYMEVYKVKQLH